MLRFPLCNIKARFFSAAVTFCRRLAPPWSPPERCSLARQSDESVYRCDQQNSSTQRREEAESVSLFSNRDFSQKSEMATDHQRSSQDGEDWKFCCEDFCANENLFCTLFYCVKVYFTTLNFFLQWSLSCVNRDSAVLLPNGWSTVFEIPHLCTVPTGSPAWCQIKKKKESKSGESSFMCPFSVLTFI